VGGHDAVLGAVAAHADEFLRAEVGGEEGEAGDPDGDGMSGGEEITASTTYTFMAQFPTVRVINLYGPTEASIGCICYEVTGKEGGKIPIGRPISNVHALVLDKKKNLVPVGVAGELHLSGRCLGLGYLHDEEKTKAAFVDNPFSEIPYSKLYRTGDLVRYLSELNQPFQSE